jgi:hypothetical protein
LKHSHAFEELLSTGEVVRRIREQACVAILLVDKNTLNGIPKKEYSGHYILLVHASEDGEVLYLDPDSNGEKRRTTWEVLEKARAVPGTDFDVILI